VRQLENDAVHKRMLSQDHIHRLPKAASKIEIPEKSHAGSTAGTPSTLGSPWLR
jgi:hypothetical protein